MTTIEAPARYHTGWQAFVDAMAGRYTFGSEVFAIACLFLSLRCLLIDPIWEFQSFGTTLWSIAVTVITNFLMFTIARRIHLSARSQRMGSNARALQALLVYLVGACVVAVVPPALDPRLQLSFTITWQRTISGTIVVLVLTYLIDQRHRRAGAIRRLIMQQQRLELQRARYSQSLHHLRTRLAAVVEREAGAHLVRLIAEIDKLSRPSARQLHEVAGQVRACSVDVVRELGHTLDLETQASSIPDDSAIAPGTKTLPTTNSWTSLRQLMDQLFVTRPFRPVGIGFFACYAVFSSVTSRAGIGTGLVTALMTFSVVFSVFGLADRTVGRWLPHQRLPTRLGVMFVAIAVATVLLTSLLATVFSFFIPLRVGSLLAIGLCLCSLGFGLATAFWEQRLELLRDLSATLESLSWESSRLQDDELAIRREVATLLHSNVQGRMAAVAARLDNKALLCEHGEIDPGEVEQGIHACATALRESLAQMRTLTEPQAVRIGNLLQELQSVVSGWAEVMDVRVDTSPEVVSQINSSGAVATAVVHIVREGLTNSMRHGHAKQVTVRITSLRQYVRITIVDDGIGVSNDFVPGLGLTSMMRSGAEVRLARRPTQGAELDVRLPAALLS